MGRETNRNLTLLLACLILSAAVGEIVVRVAGTTDSDGNFFFLSRRLKPYRLPTVSTREKLAHYLGSDSTFIMYDPTLGWKPRPSGRSHNDLYCYDPSGIRIVSSGEAITRVPRPGIIRIALFGDSFTHGDDIPCEQSWGYLLQQFLNQSGLKSEVLNFGVPGYGFDQAYLRWREQGRDFSPDIVILGLQPENIKRAVNLVRPIYRLQTGFPFSKPRFICENGALKSINIPTVAPENLGDLLERFETWPFYEHEHWYRPEDYRRDFWHSSRFVSLVRYCVEKIHFKLTFNSREQMFFFPQGKAGTITLLLLDTFKQEVENSGGRFFAAHLPQDKHLAAMLADKPLSYRNLLKRVETTVDLIHCEKELLAVAEKTGCAPLFKPHYTAEGSRIIADCVAGYILQKVKK